ncbi:MAG: alpha/beta hydrolase-fold protein [Pseudomonadota bacterium]
MTNPHHNRFYDMAPRVVRLEHRSEVLAGNPWNDPVARQVQVYLPPGYEQGDQSYPVIWYLAAYTNSGASCGNWRGFEEGVFQRVERLITSEAMGPVIVAAPDCFTALGGNQYLDSPALGNYASYLHRELVPLIDRQFRTLPGREHRAVLGKSSGGYGALNSVMQFPQYWGAMASHAGDMGFEWVYKPEFPACALRLSKAGSVDRFIQQFWASEKRGAAEFSTLMCLCLAASYDPDLENPRQLRLPFDLETLELDPKRWQRWKEHDPLEMLESYLHPLKSLRAIHIDCGDMDEYQIQFGNRRYHKALQRLGVPHHYEEFQGTHRRLDHRLDISLPVLYEAIKA